MNLSDLEERARACLAGKSRSYVADARDFAAVVLIARQTNENLTAVQERCTEQELEIRALKATMKLGE